MGGVMGGGALADEERQRLHSAASSSSSAPATPAPSTDLSASSRASTPLLPTMVTTAPLDTAAKKRTSPFAPTAFFDLAASAANRATRRL